MGKTALACAVIASLPEFAWTAVKITGHNYKPGIHGSNPSGASGPAIWEETNAHQGMDTARFLAAGARRALLVTRVGTNVPIEEIRHAIGADRNIIFESNRILDALRPDVCIALVGNARSELKPSFFPLLRAADAVVSVGDEIGDVRAGARWFRVESVERPSKELVGWLRERLGEAEDRT